MRFPGFALLLLLIGIPHPRGSIHVQDVMSHPLENHSGWGLPIDGYGDEPLCGRLLRKPAVAVGYDALPLCFRPISEADRFPFPWARECGLRQTRHPAEYSQARLIPSAVEG